MTTLLGYSRQSLICLLWSASQRFGSTCDSWPSQGARSAHDYRLCIGAFTPSTRHPVRMPTVRTVVVSGAPGTGKSTVASALAERLHLPLLSLDDVKEALADVLGMGDELWSNRVGNAAAEVVFRLANSFPGCVVEGWWRGERRVRAVQEFRGCIEVFCRCDPSVAQQRATARSRQARHPIHRDVINPTVLQGFAQTAREVQPLRLGSELIDVNTTHGCDVGELTVRVSAAMGTGT
jgi:predicted kinase